MYAQLQQRGSPRPPVNVSTLQKMKAEGEKISSLTAYDASFAALVDAAEVDVVLVGDSLGMVIQGYDTTVPVTVEDIIYHSRAVSRGLARPLLMADMPFMSYSTREQALANAVRMMQEGGAQMVKLEGGAGQVEIVAYLASHDIPVCAHLELKPQSVHKIGGYRVQGRGDEQGRAVAEDGEPLGRALIWTDERAAKQAAMIRRSLGLIWAKSPATISTASSQLIRSYPDLPRFSGLRSPCGSKSTRFIGYLILFSE